ncbi:MAG: mechanosensitive ion channel [Candidatus Binatia bacterium]
MSCRFAPVTVLLFAAACAAAAAATDAVIPVTLGEPAELAVWNRPIVTFRATIGETTPKERVERAQQRFEAIPDAELAAPPRALPARIDQWNGLMVFVGTRQMFNILREDLDPESTETLEQVGAGTVERLREVLAARTAQRSLPLLLRGIGLSLAATLAFALAAWALTRFQRWLQQRLTATAERRGGATVRQLRSAVSEIGHRAAQAAAWGLGAFAAYLWLTYVLKQFPYTAPWGDALGHRLEAVLANVASNIVASLPDVFTVLVIFTLARMAVRLLQGLFTGVEQRRLSVPGIQPETAEATRRISTVLVWLFAITVAYPYIPGSETEAFRGVSVFVGLMLSLGSAGLVNQVMSGLVVVYARAIRPGEYVKVGDTEGVVTEVGLLSTKVATARKEEITVPNAVMITQATTNYSRLADRQGALVATSVTIGYDTPWRQVHALLCLAASRTAAVRRDPPPRVVQRSLGDFYVEYMLLAAIDHPTQRPQILSDLHANIQDAFNEFGVQIMSPHFVAQPGQPVLVPREQWHAPPARDEE